MPIFRDKNTMMQPSRHHTELNSLSTSDKSEEDTVEDYSTRGQYSAAQLARTPLLILDYIQFKAARIIQRNWRGHHSRRTFDKRRKAAITIQRWWRGYRVRNNYMLFIEQKLQDVIYAHYNRAATKIQALFRGWWVRQTVHDMGGLRKMQNCAAEDLLHCVAFKLHYLMRTYSIPGVYSLRNSHCLSRVEKLLSSINYRFHNSRVHSAMINRKEVLNVQRKQFKKSSHYTAVPFAGPNYKGVCNRNCEEYMIQTKDMDRRMYKIIAAYDEQQRDAFSKHASHNLAERKRRKKINQILERKEKTNRDFCGDVIASMRRWNIWDGEKFTVEKDIFRTPENLEYFLTEVLEIMSNVQNCHCKMPVHDVVFCH